MVTKPTEPITPRAGRDDQRVVDGAPGLRIDRVSKWYGSMQAVKDVSFTVGSDELVAVLGPSGSGKTSLLSMIAGVLEPEQGSLHIGGRDVTTMPTNRRNVGMVFQSYNLFPNRTVRENIEFPLTIRKVDRASRRAAVEKMLATVELTDQADRLPGQISGGQAQRVALGRALIFEPDLLLMDEPLGALDRALRQSLQQEFRAIRRDSGVPAVYVTHDQEEAMGIADRMIIMNHGSVVASGSVREVYENPPDVWTARFLGDANVFPGSFAGPNSDLSTVQLNAGGATCSGRAVGEMASADPCGLIVRPEDMWLAEPTHADAKTTGRVTDVRFLGPSIRVSVASELGDLDLSIHRGAAAPQVFAEVSCGWADDKARIVPESGDARPTGTKDDEKGELA